MLFLYLLKCNELDRWLCGGHGLYYLSLYCRRHSNVFIIVDTSEEQCKHMQIRIEQSRKPSETFKGWIQADIFYT